MLISSKRRVNNITTSLIKSSPLCVDLDGTLIQTDLLYESLLLLLRNNIFYLFFLPIWLLKGKAYLKKQIAKRVNINASLLPYQSSVLEYLKKEHQNGRTIFLATASDELFAHAIFDHLKLFSEVFASDGKINLSSHHKAQQLIEKFGDNNFDYIGNDFRDIKVWQHAKRVLVVANNNWILAQAKKIDPECHIFWQDKLFLKRFIKAIRVHQWAKNLLIFLPLTMAHQWSQIDKWFNTLLAFVSFSLCASSVYILNDLLDLELDRKHHSKKNRPFAAGQLPILLGLALVPLFLSVSFSLSFLVSYPFFALLGFYWLTTTLYSFYLKKIALLDIIVLATLYTIRIFCGGIAADVIVSKWLLAFSMFFFLSLALVKRFSEIFILRQNNQDTTAGRGYFASDLEQIASLGSASGYISVLVLALYINSQEVTALYKNPTLLWLICPILFYWISRVWLLAHRGQLHEDPVVFALRDKTSYFIGVFAACVILTAM